MKKELNIYFTKDEKSEILGNRFDYPNLVDIIKNQNIFKFEYKDGR